jgi:tripartite-type tricarboxylate transporter receptor subunit TctC
MNSVHYRVSGPALSDLIGGQTQVMFNLAVSSVEQIRAGKLRPSGVTTSVRIESLPNVPPIGDFVSGYEASGWVGLSAPRNMPIDIVEKLNKEINAALADAPFRAEVINLGALPFATTSTESLHCRVYRQVG